MGPSQVQGFSSYYCWCPLSALEEVVAGLKLLPEKLLLRNEVMQVLVYLNAYFS